MRITAVFTVATVGVTVMSGNVSASSIMLRGQDSEDMGMIHAPATTNRSLSSTTARWVRCADDDSTDCNLNIRPQEADQDFWVRYGTEGGRKVYRKAQGKAICSPRYFHADPAYGKKKFCEYYWPGSSQSEESESEHQLSFSVRASDFQVLYVPPGVYMLKYGPLSGPFYYTEIGVDLYSSEYPCGGKSAWMPDIKRGTKKYCQLSTEVIRGPDGESGVKSSDWSLCAHEGQTCIFNGFNHGGYLVRYGYGSLPRPKFVYLKVDDPDMKIHCGKSSFAGMDPVRGTVKYCEYLQIKEAFSKHTGYWRQAGHVQPTASGGFYSETITEGVSSTEGITITREFSRTLTRSIETSASYGAGEVSQTLSLSVTSSISRAMSKSTTFSSQRSCTIQCNAGPNEEVYAYQWVMDSQVETSPATSNSFETAACIFQCTNDANGPRCSLGMNFDIESQKCVEGDGNAVQEGQSSAN